MDIDKANKPAMRVAIANLDELQALSSRLNISVVELMTIIRTVGTWVPAIERALARSP